MREKELLNLLKKKVRQEFFIRVASKRPPRERLSGLNFLLKHCLIRISNHTRKSFTKVVLIPRKVPLWQNQRVNFFDSAYSNTFYSGDFVGVPFVVSNSSNDYHSSTVQEL